MILKCSDRRRKLLSLDSPPTLMQEESDNTELENLTEEDLRVLLKDELSSTAGMPTGNQQTVASGDVWDAEDIHAETDGDSGSTEDGNTKNMNRAIKR
jgi:hypothetical protein